MNVVYKNVILTTYFTTFTLKIAIRYNVYNYTSFFKLIKDGKSEGLFLVRESTSSPGDYVLSIYHDCAPIHYQIRQHGDDAFFSIDDGPIVHGNLILLFMIHKILKIM